MNGEIREVPRDEWEQAKREREAQRAATQTAGDDWDLARECWLRVEWRRKPPERRYNQSEDTWVELGQKLGVPDAEVLEAWSITLEQAKRELPARLAGAFERVAAQAKPRKKRGAKKGAPKLTKDAVQRAFMAHFKVLGRKPGPTELARAMDVDPANFNPGRPARPWYDEAADLCNAG